MVYASGPLPVLRATVAAATDRGVVSQVALERPRGAGSACRLGCAVPVSGAGGGTRMVRTCTEGPVLRGDRVRWDFLVDGRWQVSHDALAALEPGQLDGIGVGGVRPGRDALELIAAGASAVQVGSAVFLDPRDPVRVRDELSDLLDSTGHRALTDVIATAHRRRERNP